MKKSKEVTEQGRALNRIECSTLLLQRLFQKLANNEDVIINEHSKTINLVNPNLPK